MQSTEVAINNFLDEQMHSVLTTVVGIGAIVIPRMLANGDNIPFLTVEEKHSKPQTGKTAFKRGIPQETIKLTRDKNRAEDPNSTLRGLILEEILGQYEFSNLGEYFYRPDLKGSAIVRLPSLPGKAGRIEIVVYSGKPDDLLSAVVDDEIFNPQYRTYLTTGPNTRETSVELVRAAQNRGILVEGVRLYDTGNHKPVFHPEFDPSSFLSKRSSRLDII